MTTVSTIITDALRESNLIAISASPTAAEITESLRLLNRYVAWLFARKKLAVYNYGAEGVATPAFVYDSATDIDTVYAPENSRLIVNLGAAKTVNLCPSPQDGARFSVVDASGNLSSYNLTLTGNGRTVESAATLALATDNLSREWFYRQDTGNWTRLTSLIAADESPFPEEFDDLLVIGLAMRLNPRNGVAVDPQSGQTYKDALSAFRVRYFQNKNVGVDEALLRLPSRGNWARFGSDNIFNRGSE